jgi:hypothetical protein
MERQDNDYSNGQSKINPQEGSVVVISDSRKWVSGPAEEVQQLLCRRDRNPQPVVVIDGRPYVVDSQLIFGEVKRII